MLAAGWIDIDGLTGLSLVCVGVGMAQQSDASTLQLYYGAQTELQSMMAAEPIRIFCSLRKYESRGMKRIIWHEATRSIKDCVDSD